MKRNSDAKLRQVAGENILVPVGKLAGQFHGIMALNDTGLLLWQCLSEECTFQILMDAMMQNYDVDHSTAEQDIRDFLQQLRQNGLLIETESAEENE